jgi:probable addiction module antidote protein
LPYQLLGSLVFSGARHAELLDSLEAQAAYLSEIMADGDPAAVAAAISTIARARGMTAIARDAGLSREGLYRTLSGKGNPEFFTIAKVLGWSAPPSNRTGG